MDSLYTKSLSTKDLCSQVANTDTQSLYIHWPFCPYRCFFCPFIALSGQDEFMPRYHNALKEEIITYAKEWRLKSDLNSQDLNSEFKKNNKLEANLNLIDKDNNQKNTNLSSSSFGINYGTRSYGIRNREIKTIFFGGGTPSTYPNELLLDMFGILRSEFNLAKDCEISLEVNPGTVDLEKLKLFREVGINRLSIGVQSLNNQVLQKLNRHQKSEDVFVLLEEASKIIENLSIDLIIGLPGVSSQEWKQLIETVVTWPIKHISVYFLTVHEDTPLYFGVKRNKFILPEDDEIVELYYWTINRFKENGFEQYEISNFSKKGFNCKHNQAYWARDAYKGFGLGACSFDGISRTQNNKNLLTYLESLENKKPVIDFSETLAPKDIWLERLMLGLRQNRGVLLKNIKEFLTQEQIIRFNNILEKLEKDGFLKLVTEKNEKRIVVERIGLSVVNEITVQLSNSI